MGLGTDTAYAELGLGPGASEAEAKAAWRRLASRWHPDRNPSAAAASRMQRINGAFEALREAGFPDTGATDDADAAEAAAPGGPAHAHDAAAEADTGADTDRAAQAGPDPAADADAAPRRSVRRKLRISLEEAALGCTRQLRGTLHEACSGCAGSGRQPQALACSACDGAGQRRQPGWYGLFSHLITCEACAGVGSLHPACAACAGAGRQRSAGYRVTVRLPPGVRDGDELHVDARRLRPGQAPGDLLITVAIQPHPFFRLQDDGTLRCDLPVSGLAWAAQRSVPLPTPDGLRELALQREQRDYRLAGLGFPRSRRGPRGDLLVRLQPRWPERLSTDQQILLDQLLAATAAADKPLAEWQRTLGAWQRGRNAAAS